MLSGKEIERQRKLGNIVIEPTEREPNPNSFNLRLGNVLAVYIKTMPLILWWEEQYATFKRMRTWYGPQTVVPLDSATMPFIEPLDMAVKEETVEHVIPTEGIVLWPGVLYLGHTLEYTETHNFVPFIEGRSSVGRLGLQIHLTAGAGDVFFAGDWTLENVTVHPLRVYAGVEICQICYLPVTGELTQYQGKYQGQRGPKPSQIWKELQQHDHHKPERPDDR